MPRQPIVMFERGPAFEPKAAFQGAVLASYPRDRNPLESGYLLHPERIQGKAAAIEVNYGKGRIYLFGFKPQWRAQSHGTYKFVFNVLYDYELPATGKAAPSRNPQAGRWTTLAEAAHGDLEKLVAANRAFINARGARAIEESQKLDQTIRQIQDTRAGGDSGFPRSGGGPRVPADRAISGAMALAVGRCEEQGIAGRCRGPAECVGEGDCGELGPAVRELNERENKKGDALKSYREALLVWGWITRRAFYWFVESGRYGLISDVQMSNWQAWVDSIPRPAWRDATKPQLAEFATMRRALPKLPLKDLDGNDWAADRFLKGTTIAVVWATWCGPCVKELPSLREACGALEGRDGCASVVSFNTDENPALARAFVERNGYRFPVLGREKLRRRSDAVFFDSANLDYPQRCHRGGKPGIQRRRRWVGGAGRPRA